MTIPADLKRSGSTGEEPLPRLSISLTYDVKREVHFFFNFLFSFGVWPINNVVTASGKEQRDPAIHTHASILPQTPPIWATM